MCVYIYICYMYIMYTYVKTHQVVFFKMCAVYYLKVIPQLRKKKIKEDSNFLTLKQEAAALWHYL